MMDFIILRLKEKLGSFLSQVQYFQINKLCMINVLFMNCLYLSLRVVDLFKILARISFWLALITKIILVALLAFNLLLATAEANKQV